MLIILLIYIFGTLTINPLHSMNSNNSENETSDDQSISNEQSITTIENFVEQLNLAATQGNTNKVLEFLSGNYYLWNMEENEINYTTVFLNYKDYCEKNDNKEIDRKDEICSFGLKFAGITGECKILEALIAFGYAKHCSDGTFAREACTLAVMYGHDVIIQMFATGIFSFYQNISKDFVSELLRLAQFYQRYDIVKFIKSHQKLKQYIDLNEFGSKCSIL